MMDDGEVKQATLSDDCAQELELLNSQVGALEELAAAVEVQVAGIESDLIGAQPAEGQSGVPAPELLTRYGEGSLGHSLMTRFSGVRQRLVDVRQRLSRALQNAEGLRVEIGMQAESVEQAEHGTAVA